MTSTNAAGTLEHSRWLLFQHFIRHWFQLRSTMQMAVVPAFHSALASAQINTADGCCSNISFGIGFSPNQYRRWLLFQHFIRQQLKDVNVDTGTIELYFK